MIVETRSSSFSSLARSGGDSLKLQDNRSRFLQAKDDKCSSFKDHFDMRYELTRAKVDKHGAGQTDWIDDISSCPVFHPTKEEFQDPLQYIRSIASESAKFGICKIVSPLAASVPAGVVLAKEQAGFKFTTRIQPMRLANWDKDDKITFPESGRNYSLSEYEKMANRAFSRKFSITASLPTRFVETEFWKELVSGKTRSVEYGCDVEGSAFSALSMDPLGQSKWNLKGICQLPKSTLRLLEAVIPGVTEPMLYIGMLFSMFAWHTEDHYLYSINYHHCGAPKTWYGVPGHAASGFEKVVQEHVYDPELLKDAGKGAVYDLLLGKTTMFAPKLLSEHDVPVFRAVQHPGEFVITFPRAYHAGFSHGFNCGEAVNFAMPDWFPFGAAACWRYGFLSLFPLLPHEELLCKEAMLISKTGTESQEDTGCLDANHQKCVKVAFLSLIQLQQQVHSFLKQQGAQIKKSPLNKVFCGICKHTCYVSYIICQCFPEPICSNHGREIQSCVCGSDRCLFVRDDLAELEATAGMFESEDGIVAEVLKGPSVMDSPIMDGLFTEQNMPENENYKPFTRFSGVNTGKNKEREPLGGRPSSSDALVATISEHACAIALQGSLAPAGGEEPLQSSYDAKASDNEQSVLIQGEKRPKAYGGGAAVQMEIFGPVLASDGKPIQEEEDSDSEAFRVKRRRLLPSRNRGLQVDSLGLKPDKFVVMTPKCDKKTATVQGRVNRCGARKESSTVDGECQIMIRDIIRELDLKGSVGEIIHQWRVQAGNRDISLKTHQVVVEGKKIEVLSLKGCQCLKKLLTEQKAVKLERLIQRSLSKSRSCKQVDAQDTAPPQNNGCKRLGLSSRSKSLLSVMTGEQLSDAEIEKNEEHHSKVEVRKETGLTEKRQKLRIGFLRIKASDTSDEERRVNISSRGAKTVPHNELEKLKQNKLMVHGRNTRAGADFASKSADGLEHGSLPGGGPVEYSGNGDKKHGQKVSCLKVKGPTPPDSIAGNAVKEARSFQGFESEKKGVSGKGLPSDKYQLRLISNSAFSISCRDKMKIRPAKNSHSNQNDKKLKNGSDIVSTADDTNLMKVGRKLGTDTLSKLESKKELIIHLKRKVEQSNGSLVPPAVKTGQQNENISGIPGKSLNQEESLKAKEETTCCPNQEGARSHAGNAEGQCSSCPESSRVAEISSCQDSVFVHTWQSGSKDGAAGTMKSWKESGIPIGNSLENKEHGESVVQFGLADSKVSVKDYYKDVPQVSMDDDASILDKVHDGMKSSSDSELKIHEKYNQDTGETKESLHPGCFVALSSDASDSSDIPKDFGYFPLLPNEKNGLQKSSNIREDTAKVCSPLAEIEYRIMPGECCSCDSGLSKQPAVRISSGMFPTVGMSGLLESKDLVKAQSKDTVPAHREGNEYAAAMNQM